MFDLYQEIILEEFKHPQNQGSLENPDLELVGRNSSCGDSVVVQLKFADPTQPETSPITQLKWQGVGCAISMASMSVLSAQILQQKMSLQKIRNLRQSDLESWLGLSEISAGRMKCLLLGLTTFSAQVQ
jgi:NifU-like protein involved in Fe-S cluster formation